MAKRYKSPQQVEEEVAVLGGLPLADLRERWRQLFGNPPPKSLRRELLIRACAHQIQVRAFGGLSAATKRRLRAAAEGARTGTPVSSSPRIKPGTRFVRSWGGEVHTVAALDDGFEYQGQRYRSLSAIATTITGTNWNGLAFFGLKRTSKSAPMPADTTKARQGPHGAPRSARGARYAVRPTSARKKAEPSAPARQMELFNV
jgi:hypothetical protein